MIDGAGNSPFTQGGKHMKREAIFIGRSKDKYDPYKTFLFYLYRGEEYMVIDYKNGYSESLALQHWQEQKRIDEMIARRSEPIKEYSSDVEDAMKLLYEYWEG
jgi:hypothetical protein